MRRQPPDLGLLFAVLALLGIGVVMVFSSSSVTAMQRYGDPYYFLKRQSIWAALGIGVMAALANLDYWHLRRFARSLFVVHLVLLVLVLVPGIGVVINDARRWIAVGGLQFQPSETAKLAFTLYLAGDISRAPERIVRFWSGLFPYLAMLAVVFGLIMAQPDLGTALSISGTSLVVLFAAGARLSHLSLIAAASLPVVGYLIYVAPYRLRRIFAFLDPFQDPQGYGYQIIQALYALGSGGLFGVGLGRSRQKFFYLPEQHTDFIFAILGEELGYLGGLVIIGLFVLLSWRAFMIALAAPDGFGALLATGIAAMLVVQAVMNIAVVTSTVPMTGIPLPFVSYGGSSLVFTLAGVGILLNVSRYRTR